MPRPHPPRVPRPSPSARAASLALPLLLVAACGGASAAGSAASGGSTPGGAAAADAGESRTVDTAYGPVEVPADPDRVVSLGESSLDILLALDVVPVGALSSRGGTGLPGYLAERAGDVPIVGSVREPNLEEIVQADPDVIFAAAGTDQASYEALSAIAPTVVPEPEAFGDWETETRTIGAALGEQDEAEALLDGVEERAAQLAEQPGAGGTATIVRWMPTGPLVMSSSLMAGRLVELAGDELPSVADTDKPHTDPLSLENLSQVDTDRLWVATLNADGKAALDAALASPAFRRLEAAAADRVEVVDGGVWSSAAGPLAADAVLDDIERLRTAG